MFSSHHSLVHVIQYIYPGDKRMSTYHLQWRRWAVGRKTVLTKRTATKERAYRMTSNSPGPQYPEIPCERVLAKKGYLIPRAAQAPSLDVGLSTTELPRAYSG